MRIDKIISAIIFAICACSCSGQSSQAQNKPLEATKKVNKSKLNIGDIAPNFSTKGALAGNEVNFTLAEKLKSGPLVLYFFPKVFTPGCTLEAHEFAEATADFNKLGANVIGMSADDINGLKKFSKEECRDKFMVARATPQIIKAYGVALAPLGGMTSRTSFVIAKNGKITFIHSDMSYKDHVRLTMEAVKKIK
jgi:thioredoxin-dependent peroxiredoxin